MAGSNIVYIVGMLYSIILIGIVMYIINKIVPVLLSYINLKYELNTCILGKILMNHNNYNK